MSATPESSGDRLDRRFEVWEALLLAAATIMVAWAGFQSAKWSGDQADLSNQASAARVESTRASTLAGQQTVIDVNSFTSWLTALASERHGDPDSDASTGTGTGTGTGTEVGYVPDPNELSGFLFARFRPEFKPAAEAWLMLHPLENPSAPATPFAMKEYRLAANAEAQRLERRAHDYTAQARTANERSDQYVLITIMFASVLFFAGISSKMDTRRARLLLLGTGIVVFVAATVVVLSFPKEF